MQSLRSRASATGFRSNRSSGFVSDFLDGSVDVFVLLDRDYRADADVSAVRSNLELIGVRAHVWQRKELENYLLSPTALARLSSTAPSYITTQTGFNHGRNDQRCLGPIRRKKRHFSRPSDRKDIARAFSETNEELGPLAEDPEWRLHRYPAKKILERTEQDPPGGRSRDRVVQEPRSPTAPVRDTRRDEQLADRG